jgi:hypothetical protein
MLVSLPNICLCQKLKTILDISIDYIEGKCREWGVTRREWDEWGNFPAIVFEDPLSVRHVKCWGNFPVDCKH